MSTGSRLGGGAKKKRSRLGIDWESTGRRSKKEAQQAGHRLGVDWEAEQKRSATGWTYPTPSLPGLSPYCTYYKPYPSPPTGPRDNRCPN